MERINQLVEAYNWANLEDKIAFIIDGVIEKETKQAYNKKNIADLVGYIDYTTLKCSDNATSIALFVQDIRLKIKKNKLSPLAAICTYPPFTKQVKDLLKGTLTRTCCVCGMFPSGQTYLEIKKIEIEKAISEGADEIDVVINVGELLDGRDEAVYDELVAIRSISLGHTLKVILETGELKTLQNIYRAGLIALYAGADFIKSSTGMVSVNATNESVYMMCEAIKTYRNETQRKAGLKISGGVRRAMSALRFETIVRLSLGKEWMTPHLFRFGSSSLVDDIIKELKNF